jgi:hypothetical protein
VASEKLSYASDTSRWIRGWRLVTLFFVTILMAAAASKAFEPWFQKLLYVHSGWLYERDFAQTLSDVLNTIAITGIAIVGPAILLFRSELRSVLALASDSAIQATSYSPPQPAQYYWNFRWRFALNNRARRERIARNS